MAESTVYFWERSNLGLEEENDEVGQEHQSEEECALEGVSICSDNEQNIGDYNTCSVNNMAWNPESVVLTGWRDGIFLGDYVEV